MRHQTHLLCPGEGGMIGVAAVEGHQRRGTIDIHDPQPDARHRRIALARFQVQRLHLAAERTALRAKKQHDRLPFGGGAAAVLLQVYGAGQRFCDGGGGEPCTNAEREHGTAGDGMHGRGDSAGDFL